MTDQLASKLALAILEKLMDDKCNTSFNYLPDVIVVEQTSFHLLIAECKVSDNDFQAVKLVISMIQMLAYLPEVYALKISEKRQCYMK